MVIRTLDTAEWFDISFKPRTVAIIKGAETDKGKEGGACCRKRPLVDKLELRLCRAITESSKVVSDELDSRFEEVALREFKGQSILCKNLCDTRKIMKK